MLQQFYTYTYYCSIFKFEIGPEAKTQPSKDNAVLCLGSDYVGSCLLQIKIALKKIGLTVGVMWLEQFQNLHR